MMIELRATPSIRITVQSGIQPEAVVAADRAAGRFGNLLDERSFAGRGEPARLAALRRRGAIRIAGLVAILLDELRALFDLLRPARRSASCRRAPMRSSGVCVSLVQLPWRSGLPSGVRGITHRAAGFAVAGFAVAGLRPVCGLAVT